VVAEDYMVQFERRLLQIQRQKWLDGSVHVFTKNNTELLVEELHTRPKKNEEEALSA
jgi:hypothetical protein